MLQAAGLNDPGALLAWTIELTGSSPTKNPAPVRPARRSIGTKRRSQTERKLRITYNSVLTCMWSDVFLCGVSAMSKVFSKTRGQTQRGSHVPRAQNAKC
jgi:hypothetical protein